MHTKTTHTYGHVPPKKNEDTDRVAICPSDAAGVRGEVIASVAVARALALPGSRTSDASSTALVRR
eukprot:1668559-Pyramimonas_sp.AAC.1